MSTVVTVIDQAKVEQINREYRLAEQASAEAFEHAIACGRMLIAVKAEIPHGEWGVWLTDHFEGSERTAQVYMQVAAAPAEEIRSGSADLPALSINAALKQISKPKPQRTAGEAASQLRELGGGERSPELQRRLDEARSRLQADVWSDQQVKRADRIRVQLEDVVGKVLDAKQNQHLSASAVAGMVRQAAVQARQAAAQLDELAFSFER